MGAIFAVVLAFAGGYVARIVRPVRFLIGLNPIVKNLQESLDALHARLEEIEAASSKAAAAPGPSSSNNAG